VASVSVFGVNLHGRTIYVRILSRNKRYTCMFAVLLNNVALH
jgi:hypothetical protein